MKVINACVHVSGVDLNRAHLFINSKMVREYASFSRAANGSHGCSDSTLRDSSSPRREGQSPCGTQLPLSVSCLLVKSQRQVGIQFFESTGHNLHASSLKSL